MRHGAHFLLLAVLSLAIISTVEASAQSRLTICNQGKETVGVAILFQSAPFYPITEKWQAHGWGYVEPGCLDVIKLDHSLQAFLSLYRKPESGNKIMHFEFESDAVRESLRNGVVTAERFFCVTDGPFNREFATLAQHETCPPGYYPQLFNLLVKLDLYTNFTLNVNR